MEKLRPKLIIGAWFLIVLLVMPGVSISQNQNQSSDEKQELKTESGNAGVADVDDLKQIRTAAESSGDLAENAKKMILDFVDQAIIFRESEVQSRVDIESLKQTVQKAPERIKKIEAELDDPLSPPENVASEASAMEPGNRERYLRNLETELANAISGLNQWNKQLNALKELPVKLRTKAATAKKQQSDITDKLKAIPSPDVHPLFVKAQQAALLAEQAKIQTELELFENQLQNYDAATALLATERDLASRQAARLEMLIKSWQSEVQRLREFEAKKGRIVAEDAKKLAADLPPVIQKQYDITIEHGKALEKVTAEEADILGKLEMQQAQLKQLEADYAIAREQVKYPMHTTETIGLALREQRRTLPSIENFRRQSAKRRVQMGEVRATMLELDRQRNELSDLDKTVDHIINSETDLEDTDLDLLKTELRRLLGNRREIVKKLQASYQRLFKNIQSLEFIEQQIVAQAQEEALFLDENLLWIRSAKIIGIQDLQTLPSALKWLFSPPNWWQTAQTLMLSLKRYPIQWALGMLIPIIFICLRPWARRDLSRIALKVYSLKTDSFVLTLRALALTVRASFGWPLLMGLTGWQLVRLAPPGDFTFAAGDGLFFAAETLAGSLFLYEMCWKDGVAKVHFKWPESVRRTIRRHLRWFIPLLVITSFILAAVQTHNDAGYTDSLGRLAMTLLMMGFFGWAAYVLRFSGEIVSMLIHRKRDGWLVRLRFIWYPLTMGVPLLLILLAAIGYYYSASALYLRMGETIALILGLIIVKDLLLRWLFITQRRLTYDELKRKKEAEAEKQEKAELSEPVEGEAVVIEEPEINLNHIYNKNRQLLRTVIFFSAAVGLWAIWSNVLPALNFLENVQLWSYSSEVDGVRKMLPITLANLMITIIVTIVTIVAAKNLPSLLEIILLNQFSMDYGARHAFTTIFSYTITAVGVVIAFSTIGLKWGNLQWLIAALSVGLGFGLQEVVANFICGLIVLFERPFRIGDTVTIAEISGTVTRIQIRATTILDWDRKELIVPNKEFIVGKLINWSLTDNVMRFKIPIGIAYGSDTDMAEKLLLQVAERNPLTLDNPAPQAIFKGFGDNSLNFEMRVFVNGITDWMPLLHQLNKAIDREFRKAGISISFPQRDVHLDQSGPLEVRVVPDR